MRYEFRPLTWTDPETDPRASSATFRASWGDTLVLLTDELRCLEAVEPAVFQVDVREGDVLVDGRLRANAKVGHPGVAVSFQSKFGPLRYATDAYDQPYYGAPPGWQANIRAIALALKALRAIDRYGVSRRGEQYTGWKALPASDGHVFASLSAALQWLADKGVHPGAPALANPGDVRRIYRQLARTMHPDTGGDPADWDRLDAAKQLLTAEGVL